MRWIAILILILTQAQYVGLQCAKMEYTRNHRMEITDGEMLGVLHADAVRTGRELFSGLPSLRQELIDAHIRLMLSVWYWEYDLKRRGVTPY